MGIEADNPGNGQPGTHLSKSTCYVPVLNVLNFKPNKSCNI